MAVYELRFAAGGENAGKRLEFSAEDASAALIVAHRESADRAAELWQGDQKLCTIRRSPVGNDGFWQVS